MPKRGMANIVDQRQCLDQFRIQVQRVGHGSSDLRYFQCVCQAIPKVIRETRRKNLSLGFQSAERSRMHNSISIARIFAPIPVWLFREAAPSSSAGLHGPWRKGSEIGNGRNLRAKFEGRPPRQDLVARNSRPRSASSELIEFG